MIWVVGNQLTRWKVDSRICYPSYKSFDEFIDVEGLKSLDRYVTETIESRLQSQDHSFHTGPLTLKPFAKRQPGSKIIYLTKPVRAKDYTNELGLDKPNLWEPTDETKRFSLLWNFIGTLPFKRIGRAMIMHDSTGQCVTPHRDHLHRNICHEFIWFRTNLNKPFFVLNPRTDKRLYVSSYSAWFDTCNQFHGADSYDGLSVSIRVDGSFSDQLRKLIPQPQINTASTAALWASVQGH
jgi:hypothetical protein